MRYGAISAVITFLMFLSPGAQAGQLAFGKGPMHITGQTPLHTLRLDVVPTRYDILDAGQAEISAFNSLTNRWNVTDHYLLDIEIVQNIVGITVGMSKGTELGVTVPFISFSGGCLDRFIIDFHNRLGLGQAGRIGYPSNSMQVSLIGESGDSLVVLDNNDRKTILGDVSLFARSRIYRGESRLRSLIFTALLRFPTACRRGYYGSGGADGAFSISSSHRINRLFLYTTLGYGIYGSGSLIGLDLRPYQWTLFAALEVPVNKNISVIVQQLSNSGAARDCYEFSKPTHELTIGVKQYVSRRIVLEYGIIENLFSFRNSVDFGLNFSIIYRP